MIKNPHTDDHERFVVNVELDNLVRQYLPDAQSPLLVNEFKLVLLRLLYLTRKAYAWLEAKRMEVLQELSSGGRVPLETPSLME